MDDDLLLESGLSVEDRPLFYALMPKISGKSLTFVLVSCLLGIVYN